MRIMFLVLALAFSIQVSAESLMPSPTPSPIPISSPLSLTGCTSPADYDVYRCGCRIDLISSRGGVSSEPLLMNGSYVIFSATNRTGEACTGQFRPDACRSALDGQTAQGRLACVLVRVSGGDITIR